MFFMVSYFTMYYVLSANGLLHFDPWLMQLKVAMSHKTEELTSTIQFRLLTKRSTVRLWAWFFLTICAMANAMDNRQMD